MLLQWKIKLYKHAKIIIIAWRTSRTWRSNCFTIFRNSLPFIRSLICGSSTKPHFFKWCQSNELSVVNDFELNEIPMDVYVHLYSTLRLTTATRFQIFLLICFSHRLSSEFSVRILPIFFFCRKTFWSKLTDLQHFKGTKG